MLWNSTRQCSGQRTPYSFNEATAKCCGIPVGVRYGIREQHIASMRPQRNAVEFDARACYAAFTLLASMRPQRNAVEFAQESR